MRSSPRTILHGCLRPRRSAFISVLIWYPCSPGSFLRRQLSTNCYPFRHKRQSSPAGSLFSVGPPVGRLDVVGMIIPPRSSHSTGIDVVRNDVAVIRELSLAESAQAILRRDLSVH